MANHYVWQWEMIQGKSIEHAYWNVFNTLSQAFAGDDSFLYGGASHMHFSGTILVHS